MSKKNNSIMRELRELKKFFYRKFLYSPKNNQDIVDAFHKLFYESGKWDELKYFGVPMQKCPMDLAIYQEMLYELKPDLVIECGTAFGGSALYMAHLLDVLGKGKVVSVDINFKQVRPQHPRITYITGSSTDPKIFEEVKKFISADGVVMVILDSDHSRDHVLREMQMYHSLVTFGSYMIVEDTNANGHPVFKEFGPGPMEALDEFMKTNHDFVIDESREKFFLTYNPRGYLKKAK